MKRIAKNALTGWAVAFLAAYWIIGFVAPPTWFNGGIALAQFICSVAALYKWGPSAFHFVTEKEGQAAIEGDLLSLVGIATLALGAAWSGLFVGAWLLFDTPDSWLNTPYSAFGRGLSVAGFFLLYRSTTVRQDSLRPVNWWVLSPLVLLAAVALFFAGARWKEQQLPDLNVTYSEMRPRCPSTRPVLGNVNSRGIRIYHTMSSPYRAMVSPEECFASEDEARAAGYRAPG